MVRGGQRSPCHRGSVCLGDRRPGGGNPRLQGENPAGGGCWATGVKRVTGVLRLRLGGWFYCLGCAEDSCFSLSNPDHKRRHAFKIKNIKTKKQHFHRQNPQPNLPTKNPPNKQTNKTPHMFVLRAANSPRVESRPAARDGHIFPEERNRSLLVASSPRHF